MQLSRVVTRSRFESDNECDIHSVERHTRPNRLADKRVAIILAAVFVKRDVSAHQTATIAGLLVAASLDCPIDILLARVAVDVLVAE